MDLLKKELDALKYSIKDQEKGLELSRLSLDLHKRQLEKKKHEMAQYVLTLFFNNICYILLFYLTESKERSVQQ